MASDARKESSSTPALEATGRGNGKPADLEVGGGRGNDAERGGSSRWPRVFTALGNHRYFRLLWLGTIASFAAMQMQQVARSYLAYELAGDATTLGIVSVSMALPMLLLSLVGGVAADRLPKRNIIIASQATMGVLAAAIAILIYLKVIAIWHLILVGLVQGAAFSFNMPARQSLIPQLVGPRDMQNAIAINTTGMNATGVVGPALAGMLIALPLVGLGGVFVLMTLCYALVVFFLFRIPPNYVVADYSANQQRWHADGDAQWEEKQRGLAVFSGIQYIRSSPTLSTVMLLGFVPIALGMPIIFLLMPVFAKDVLGPDYSFGLGLMLTASGVGALIGSFFIAALDRLRRRALLQLIMGTAWGLSLIAFAVVALLGSFPAELVLLGAMGLASSAYMVLNQGLLFSVMEPALFGRVMGVYMMAFSVFPLVGLPGGALADRIGGPLTALGVGVLLTVFMAAFLIFNSRFRRMETEPQPQWNEMLV